jgi:hypothetical protein
LELEPIKNDAAPQHCLFVCFKKLAWYIVGQEQESPEPHQNEVALQNTGRKVDFGIIFVRLRFRVKISILNLKKLAIR